MLTNLSLFISSITIDHSNAIRKGAIKAFGESVKILSCWVHLLINCKKKQSKLLDQDNFKKIRQDIYMMHLCSNIYQLKKVSQACITNWNSMSEIDFTNWFQSIYLDARWSNWFIGCRCINWFIGYLDT